MAAPITFRLRPGRDDDLIKALASIPEDLDRSDFIRAALRAFLGGTKGNVLPPGLSPACGQINRVELEASGIPTLVKIEKTDANIDDGLDDLLGSF